MENDTKLHVSHLSISFTTNDGKLKAVRDISFDLKEGETLSIVGESGSGKSVTSKAILGILAGNSIIEDGEIIYDGQDLLKITEEDFHHIRGDKIAMIFQDPMSSLNPIIKIGRQLTEAMILKGKARQKESREKFNTFLKTLKNQMIECSALGYDSKTLAEKCKAFDVFEYKHLDLESEYNTAHDACTEAIGELEDLIFELEKNAANDMSYRVKHVCKNAGASIQKYVVNDRAEELKQYIDAVPEQVKLVKAGGSTEEICRLLTGIQGILKEAADFPMPNFFALGYYVKFSGQDIPEMTVPEMNAYMRKYLDDNFMLDFIACTVKALQYSAQRTYDNITAALSVLKKDRAVFENSDLDRSQCNAAVKEMTKYAMACIDCLDIKKDSIIYTFGSGLDSTVRKYFAGTVKNVKEQKRYDREVAKQEAQKARGKEPDWQVVAPATVDLEVTRNSMLYQIDKLIAHLDEILAARDTRNYEDEAVAIIDYLKANACGVVNKVTYSMAKERAIKLMKEVGIANPRQRFNQYPFEFSGGMRQRIVIAIALSADPDILICDEPTTALDVTIQSQILELINKLKAERNLSVIFITHDLGVVANMADRIAVMYAGKIVEYGTSADIFYHSAHPYTWALLSSLPDLDTNEKLDAIPGTPPDMHYPPVGDAFAARNKYAMKIDFEKQPPMFQISDTHYAATWLLHPDAPKVDPPKAVTDRIERMRVRREQQNGQ